MQAVKASSLLRIIAIAALLAATTGYCVETKGMEPICDDDGGGEDRHEFTHRHGRCCNNSGGDEWALIGKDGDKGCYWKKLGNGECVGGFFKEDCEGMTCGGGFYKVKELFAAGNCVTPGTDRPPYNTRRWTPTTRQDDAMAPKERGCGSTFNNIPPGYEFYDIPSSISTDSFSCVTPSFSPSSSPSCSPIDTPNPMSAPPSVSTSPFGYVPVSMSPSTSPVSLSPLSDSPVTNFPISEGPTNNAPVSSTPTSTSAVSAKPTNNSPTSASPTTNPTASPVTATPITATPSPPSSSPISPVPITQSPTTTTVTVMDMYSTVEWNINCSLNDTSLVSVAQIVEESVHDDVQAQIHSAMIIQKVLVNGLCNRPVPEHIGYPSSRRMQTAAYTTKIEFTTTVQANCVNCYEEIFDSTNSALIKVVDDGSLSATIHTKSGGIIQALVHPGSTFSTFNEGMPTARPTVFPTTKSSKKAKGAKSYHTKSHKAL